jgi:hypothetical protein
MARTKTKERVPFFAGFMPYTIACPGDKARQGNQEQKEQQCDIHDAAGVLKHVCEKESETG